jgi:uncharacterized protein DUF1706
LTPPVTHTRRSVIRRVENEYRALDRAVRALSRGGLDRPVPGFGSRARADREHWTYKDMLAHILFWKQYQLETIAGLPHAAKPPRGSLAQENRWIYDRWHRKPARDVVAWHRRLHREVMRTLRTVGSEVFAKKHRAQWPGDLVTHSEAHRRRHLEPR